MALDQIVQHAVRLVPHRLRGKVKSLPLVGAAQRLIVDRSLSGRVFVHTVDAGPAKGITFQVKLPEDKGIWTGTYEAAFADRLETEMRPGMVGYDIGAWHGYFSGIMLAGGASAVVAFDPLPDNRTRLDKMIALNPGSDVAIEPCALSDHEGTATLTLIDATSKAKLSDSPFEPDKAQGIDIEVALSTMDAVVASGRHPPPAIVKIDVEGAEARVLQGAAHTLMTHQPVLLAEIHSDALMAECRSLLESFGYQVEVMFDETMRRQEGAAHIIARVAKASEDA